MSEGPDKKFVVGEFTVFYTVIAVCTVIGFVIFTLNIVLGCCSRYSKYWNDRHTGNRWIVSLWTATPHKQPALDYTELEDIAVAQEQHYNIVQQYQPEQPQIPQQLQYLELKKRESDI